MEDLPRKLNKKEAKKNPAVEAWLLEHYPHDVAYELKVGKNKVKTHQNAALNQVLEKRFAHKFPDTGRRNPFDGIVLKTGKVHPCVITCEGKSFFSAVF